MPPPEHVVPDWPAPRGVHALVTTRRPDATPYGAFNLAAHVGDDPARVAANRAQLRVALGGADACWLEQVHGIEVVAWRAASATSVCGDAAWTRTRRLACAVLSADCLPVLLCARDGSCVAVAHGGWRGLADGVLAALVAELPVAPADVLAWIGPGIGAARYEVGPEVAERVRARWGEGAVRAGFRGTGRDGTSWADLEALARFELRSLGIAEVHGGGFCTARDPRFYSHRRDGVTGRMASLIWIA